MTGAQRRRMEKLEREAVFFTDNAADFPANSPADKVSAEISPKQAQALDLDAKLTVESGERRAAQEAKDEKRDLLLDQLRDFATAAIGIGNEVPGLTAQFRVPTNRSDQNLIAAATAFFDASEAHKEKFAELGLDAGERNMLASLRDEFSAARAEWESAVVEHAGAGGDLDAVFRDMMALSRKRSAIVKIKYKDNPGKLAAWTVASHLERPPKRNTGGTGGGSTPTP